MFCLSRVRRGPILAGLLVLAATAANASEQSDTAEAEADAQWLQQPREGARSLTYWLVRNVDGWFGDKPFDDSGGQAGGRIQIGGLHREDSGFQASTRFRLDVTMPNVNEQAYLFVGRGTEDELVQDQPEAFSRAQLLLPQDRAEDQAYFGGLGYHLREHIDFRLGIRGGYKPYAQARYRRVFWPGDTTALEFRETLFVASGDGLGATTALDLTHALSTQRMLRWRNSATVSTRTRGAAWSTSLGVFHRFGPEREISLEALANGETARPVKVREYGLRGIYRQPIYRDWLIGEIIIGHFWPRDDRDPDRRESWALGIGLEMIF
ncbi:hypothetical protein [Thioalkalivibrio sp. ALJT]|uniref:hypothetical protein n=1 Tax=Thioalkalivibrio sp. ALJT TaxID=1158146 RepID=UPI00056FE47D|nr:hypothetical protein [Thioalkalivibrio sp. ALJT]